MSREQWIATVEDSVESQPFAVVADLVIAVRTPRSRDFVTVEIGSASGCIPSAHPVLKSSIPPPCMSALWHGKLHIGEDESVTFLRGEHVYRLSLTRICEAAEGFPWVRCDFMLTRE